MHSILESGFRPDLVEAQRGVLANAARAGAWWTGEERLAMAAEVRRARDHADLPPWEAPSTAGLVADDHVLPAAAVDAVWRITNHPGSLTAAWYHGIVAGLPSPEHYVELVAVVAPVSSIDAFARVMGLDPIPLPDPVSGAPSSRTIEGAEVTTHWVPTAPIGGANVMKALSIVPDERPAFDALLAAQYLPPEALLGDLDWSRPTMDRRQIELVATQTSLVNECFY
ncbi:MAG: alkylhydroperoxidase-related (seleno)protein [Actinomycetota bacterium]